MLLYLFPNNLNDSEKTFVAGVLVVITLFLVTSPKETISTCRVLFSFLVAFWRVAWQSWLYSSKRVRTTLIRKMRKLILCEGREWLDEMEKQITE